MTAANINPAGGGGAMRLTAEMIARFHTVGFLSVEEPIVGAGEIDRLRAIYDRMFEERAGRDEGNQFDLAGVDDDERPPVLSQILHPQLYHPELAGPALEAVSVIARQLLGPEARTEIFHAILKPGGIGAPTPWHQDEAYWDPAKQYRSISIWMPLQEATLDNGCLWFEEGSHEWDVLPHRSIGGDVRVHGLELVDPGVISRPVACPLPPGGVTIHRNRTAHHAGPNRTGAPRRALIFSATLPDRPFVGERRFVWNEAKRTARAARAIVDMNGAPDA